MKYSKAAFAVLLGACNVGTLAFAGQEVAPILTSVEFVDKCTHEAVTRSSPNGLYLQVKIKGLPTDDPIQLDIREGHPTLGVGTVKDARCHKKKTLHPKNGEVFFQKEVSLNDHYFYHLQNDPNQTEWLAQVTWKKKSHKKLQNPIMGSGNAALSIINPKLKKVYVPVGQPICKWEGETQLQSDYIFNASETTQSFHKECRWMIECGTDKDLSYGPSLFVNGGLSGGSWNFSSGGGGGGGGGATTGGGGSSCAPVSTGCNPAPTDCAPTNCNNSPPDCNPNSGNNGSLMIAGIWVWANKTCEVTKGQESYLTYDRCFNLAQDQGGFFGSRVLHTRYHAQEWILGEDQKSGCYQWNPGRHGKLDIGRSSQTLYVVPEHISTDLKESVAFIDRMRPRINTCGTVELPCNPVQQSCKAKLSVNRSEDISGGIVDVSLDSDNVILFYPDLPSNGPEQIPNNQNLNSQQ